MSRSLLVFFIAILFTHPIQAQVSDKKVNMAEEAAIIEQMLTKVTAEADGTGLLESTRRVHIQSEAGLQAFGILTMSYEKAFHEGEIVYVRVRKPDGSVISTPLDDIQDVEPEITREAP
ncbi:MAG TPA: DUF3857 domain-containing protein, partial [Terriglobales bacterium]